MERTLLDPITWMLVISAIGAVLLTDQIVRMLRRRWVAEVSRFRTRRSSPMPTEFLTEREAVSARD